MNKNDLEKIYAETYSGICIYYRDTTLGEDLIAKYHTGQVLQHNGIVDMTNKSTGLNGNTRYLIASVKAKDVSLVNPAATHFGHFVLSDETLALTGSVFFVVLDVYRVGDKTQVTLLHIKKDFANLFSHATTNLEEEIVRLARAVFEGEVNEKVLPELRETEWANMTKAPIGFDGQDNLLYKETEPGQAGGSNAGKGLKGVKKKKRNWRFWQRIKKDKPKR